MNISGIRPSIGFYDQNSIKFRPEFSTAPVTEEQESQLVEDEAVSVELSEEGIAEARKNQTFGSYDFASQYKPGATYDMKGADSDINSLDVEKAVSDMQKDSALHRYQYFVSSKPNAESQATQPRPSEDFSL